MNTINLPGYIKHEYLLVIDIPEVLRTKIEKVREELVQAYRIKQPKTGRPHVGLVRFASLQQQEEKIIECLQRLVMTRSPFIIEFSGFGSYPMHSIFIKISTQEKIRQLVRLFKEARPLLKFNGDSPHFIEDPVVPLAARLDKDIYKAAMLEYSGKHFSGRFVATSVLLLKRKDKYEKYHIARRFELEQLQVGIKQGELF